MRFARIPAFAATAALVAASTLVMAAPASAATTVGLATFYGASDFGVESGGYPAGVDWFFGDVSGTDGSHAFTPAGLAFNATTPGEVQILNQNVTTPADAAALTAILTSAGVDGTAGWTFQLPLFTEGGADFTTLRPEAANTYSPSGNWITSSPIAATTTTPAFAAGAVAPFADLADAIYGDAAPTLLGYGLFVSPGDTPVILDIEWDGDVSMFSPVPTRTITPNPITPADFSTPGKGLTLTGTGWIPGSDVYIDIEDADGNDVFHDEDTYTVDANGNVTVNIVLATAPAVGVYSVVFDDDDLLFHLEVFPDMEFTVAAAAPVLAATGLDQTGALLGGASLLLLGGLAVAFTVSRRARV